jgi:hypothetical protein
MSSVAVVWRSSWYDHRCRRKGCGYSKEAPDNESRPLPEVHMRLED